MYEIRVAADFAAAHFLRDYNGKCENLHGHNYKVYAHVRGGQLNEGGMLIDFSLLKGALKAVCETLDHKNLNDMPCFDQNPSAERIAVFIYNALLEALKKKGVDLSFSPECAETVDGAKSAESFAYPNDAANDKHAGSTLGDNAATSLDNSNSQSGKSNQSSQADLKKRTWLYAVDVFETETSRARYIAG